MGLVDQVIQQNNSGNSLVDEALRPGPSLVDEALAGPSFKAKAIDFLTGGHVPAEPTYAGSELTAQGKLDPRVQTGDPGFFNDPIVWGAMGAVAGVRAAGGVAGKALAAGREAVGWMTGGASEVPAMAKGGVETILKGTEAKNLGKLAEARAGKPFAEVARKVEAPTASLVDEALKVGPKVAPVVQPGAPSGGKQPWEMTADEWTNKVLAEGEAKTQFGKLDQQTRDIASANAQDYHYGAVEDAVKAGKPVPPEVLADYPDLKAPSGGKQPWEMTREEFKSNPPEGMIYKPQKGEIISGVESDGTISVGDSFFEHGLKDRKDIIAHEKAHLLEGTITPEYKAKLFDNKTVMDYRGKNINEKLANMIVDGKLPPEVLKDYPDLKAPAAGAKGGLSNEAGAIDPDLLTLGTTKFLKEDVIPTSKTLANIMRQSGKDIRNVLSPVSAGPQAAQTAGIMRKNLAEMARSTDRAQEALKQARGFFVSKDPQFNYDFIHSIETGAKKRFGLKGPNPDDSFLDHTASVMRSLMNKKVDEVRALGTGKLEEVIENYFPHMWQDPKKANEAFMNWYAKRPMEGSKGFLKKRTIPTTQEGLEMGLTPISNNPVDLTILKLREMDKYIMAQKTMKSMKDTGLATFVRAGQKAPDGLVPINDRIATVYAPPELQGPVGRTILGAYYAPEDAARIINNYLSPGLRGNQGFRAYLGAANILNQAQLGLSAFHLGFTSVDAMTSKMALALGQASHADVGKAVVSMLQVPIAPVENILRGRKLYKEWMTPGSQSTEISKLVDAVVTAGGRARMDNFYRTEYARKAADAFRSGNIIGGLIRAPFAAVDLAAKPIMEYIVPRQKLGVFADLARYELDRLGKAGATEPEIHTALAKIWDSVDNRMGQLVYDNLFWNKMGKDLSMASVRSLGWNLGTFRELGGGGIDLAKQVFDIVNRRSPELTYKMAYTAALPITTGILGATLYYLYNGKAPETLKDYYFPKTGQLDENGRPARVALPSYMKDLVHYYETPGKTLVNKLHPALAELGQMLENEDFYGVQIADWSEGVGKTLSNPQIYKDYASYLGKSVLPFGVRFLQRERQLGGSLVDQALPFVGITPAPAYVNKTSAETLMSNLVQSRMPKATITKAQFEQFQAKRQAKASLRRGQEISPEVEHELGKMSNKQLKTMVSDVRKGTFEKQFGILTLKEGIQVYKKANAEEQPMAAVLLMQKLKNTAKNNPSNIESLTKNEKEFLLEELYHTKPSAVESVGTRQ